MYINWYNFNYDIVYQIKDSIYGNVKKKHNIVAAY